MATQSLVATGKFFAEVSKLSQVMVEIYREAQGGFDKRPLFWGSLSRNHSRSQLRGNSS